MPKYRVKRHSVTQPTNQSYRLIPLTQGQNAIVDTADFEWLSQWNWSAHWAPNTRTFYASKYGAYMAREILKCKPTEEVDHINHDTLDNRKQNLRKCTQVQNVRNRKKHSRNTSGFKGVTRENGKWRAQIVANRKMLFLGYFSDKKEAALAYDIAALRYHGEFAHLNFQLENPAGGSSINSDKVSYSWSHKLDR